MADGIFLLQSDRRLVPMTSERYESEDLLQMLIAEYPDLLAGEQMDERTPRRWLLVKREMPIPSEEDGSGRWSLDHLFLDQEAIPTLIEVKRSTDTRLRREVVGQMLDYAANAVVYWPMEQIRGCFERLCEDQKIDPAERLAEFLADKSETGHFWTNVETNLQAGRIRMVFVADVIPAELRRIVEFLNEQMKPAQVLAVEIKQYVGEGMRTLVPRVYGGTQAAEAKKGTSRPPSECWTEETFFTTLSSLRGDAETNIARRLYDWVQAEFGPPKFGSGREYATYSVEFLHGAERHVLFDVGGHGPVSQPEAARNRPANVAIRLKRLKRLSAFADEELHQELLRRLNSIPGVKIRDSAHPNFPLSVLTTEVARQQFQDIMLWVAKQIESDSEAIS